MLAEILKDVPRGVKIVLAAIAALAIFIFLRGRLYYFRNPFYLGAFITGEVILASLWHFETIFFPMLMVCFLWAGMSLPFTSVATTSRWFILAVAALVGFIMWMRERRHSYSTFHLVALFCVISGLASAIVSTEPLTALLKVFSFFLLFLYGATGARLAMLGREVAFMKGLVTACEVILFLTAIAYLGGQPIFGNPNSLGAVMAVLMTPFLLWGYMIADTRSQRYRRMAALMITAALLYVSLSRAAMFAAGVTVLIMCFAMRRQRLLAKGLFGLVLFMAAAAMWNPQQFEEFVKATTNNILYKGKDESEGVFGSRKSPWQETAAVIQEHPWLGSGFGTSDLGRWADRPNLDIAPSTGGLYTREGTNREHGNSYLALVEYMGLLGIIPFVILLFLVAKMIALVCVWMRRTANPYHCAIPLAMMLLAGMVHAFFEDWLIAVGYYLCVFFWTGGFWLRDVMPTSLPAVVRAPSAAHPRIVAPPSGILVPHR